MPRSLIVHMTWWVASVCSETKSQNVSCAVWACGISRSGCGLAAWMMSGNLIAVLDEEHRHVVADQVEVALVGVELHREPADVADRVGRAARAGDGREPHEHSVVRPAAARKPAFVTDDAGAVGLEDAVRRGAAGVNDPLGDALVVEVGDLLAQVEVLEQRRPAIAGLERMVGVGQPQALRRRQVLPRRRGDLGQDGRGGSGLGGGRGGLATWRHQFSRQRSSTALVSPDN